MKLSTLVRKNNNPFNIVNWGLEDLFPDTGSWPTSFSYPALNVTHEKDHVLVEAEVPGVAADDLHVCVENNILTISGEKKEEKSVECRGIREISYGAFERSIALPSDVDATKVEAESKNGILRIRMEKSEKAKAIQIKVKGE